MFPKRYLPSKCQKNLQRSTQPYKIRQYVALKLRKICESNTVAEFVLSPRLSHTDIMVAMCRKLKNNKFHSCQLNGRCKSVSAHIFFCIFHPLIVAIIWSLLDGFRCIVLKLENWIYWYIVQIAVEGWKKKSSTGNFWRKLVWSHGLKIHYFV